MNWVWSPPIVDLGWVAVRWWRLDWWQLIFGCGCAGLYQCDIGWLSLHPIRCRAHEIQQRKEQA